MTIPPCLPDRATGPDVVYSALTGPVIQFDGACYSDPQPVTALTNEDSMLFISNGTTFNDCARVECGPLALYCYESVSLPVASVLVFQPQHFPAPIISLPINPSRCYHKPAFVKTVFENYGTVVSGLGEVVSGSYALPAELTACGVAYVYSACNGNDQLVVIDESSPTILYAGRCWTDPQPSVSYDPTAQRIAGTDVTPVSGCQDLLCTGSDSSGPTIGYTDQQLGNTVNVQFDHLDVGIPYFGVASEKIDDGESGLKPGIVTLSFSPSNLTQAFVTVAAAGRLEIRVSLRGYTKTLRQVRGGVATEYPLGQGENVVFLDVIAGDVMQLRLERSAKVAGTVKWRSAPLSLRKYDEAILGYVGTTTVRAVSFCGLVASTPYVFYDTLPADSTSVYPNPDTYLTVQGATGPEYVLVTSHAAGDRIPVGPSDTVAYAGEGIAGPLTFRFYTGRGAAGAHGEMDVWLDAPGQLPDVLAVGQHRLLVRSDAWYRRLAQVGDTRRSSLTVPKPGEVYTLPGVYVSSEGDLAVISGVPQATITNSGTVYNLTGTAYGLAYTVK